MDYLEFIARVTSHILDKGQVMIRYFGLYTNAHLGKKRKMGDDPSHPPIIDDEVSFVPSKGWAEMIRKVFEVDPLICPQCGGEMKVISLFSFELAILNVLYSFQYFSKQKLCIKSRILLHVKKGNSSKFV